MLISLSCAPLPHGEQHWSAWLQLTCLLLQKSVPPLGVLKDIKIVLFSLAFVQRQGLLSSREYSTGLIYHLNSGNGDQTVGFFFFFFFAITMAKVCAQLPN